MLEDSTVSVIIPTYNRPGFLRGALATVLNQRGLDLQIIVIDDGSESDYASEIVTSFRENSRFPIRLSTLPRNRGLSHARNVGIDMSEAPFVSFLDDDDRWDIWKLKKQRDYLKRNPDKGLVTCLSALISQDLRYEYIDKPTDHSEIDQKEIFSRNVIGSPSTVFMRRGLAESIRFDENLTTKQDWDFYIRCANEAKLGSVSEYLCLRLDHQSMSSSTSALKSDKNRVISKHKSLFREYGVIDEAYANYFLEIGQEYLKNGYGGRAREAMRNALRYSYSYKAFVGWLLSFSSPLLIKRILGLYRMLLVRYRKRRVEFEFGDLPDLWIPEGP